ncbi:hypothetical protein GWI33_011073, partial [Rhynchophorus ferrugineus]
AIGATVVSPVAFADISVYGRAHVSLDLLDDGRDYQEVNLSSNSSRLGFKADTKINDNLTAFAQVEQQINFTSGSDDGGSIDFATRDTFVGVKGDFGQVRVGRFDSPFKVARNPINFFGDQLGDIRNLTRAAAYKVIPELNLAALYQFLKHDNNSANPDAQVFGVAADYKFAPNTYVRGQYLYRDVDATDANASLIAVGLEHRLDKALRHVCQADVRMLESNENAHEEQFVLPQYQTVASIQYLFYPMLFQWLVRLFAQSVWYMQHLLQVDPIT